MMMRLLLSCLGASLLAAPAAAQQQPVPAAPAAPAAATSERAEQLLALLQGRGDPAALFTPAFLAQVPPQQIAAISQQLIAANGAPQRVERVEPRSATEAVVTIGYERALVRMNMAVEPAAPGRIATLLITGTEPRGGDTAAAIVRDLAALPGQVSFAIARLGDNEPALIAQHQPDRALAIGSAFKLVILAELSRQVAAGERRWSDVVALDRRSLPSGMLQSWPQGAPLTLHSLATLMISISDNTATDALLHLLGRERVERMMTTIGMSAAGRNRPFLSTLEAFALKLGDPALLPAWVAADEAGRRRLLADRVDRISAEDLRAAALSSPRAIDQVEWFASAADLVRIMDWLRRHGDATAQAILAVNPGLGRPVASDYAYLGFKGGSEPGVINLTFLVRNRAGAWHVVTGSWNNPAAPVEEARFLGLMTRAVGLVR